MKITSNPRAELERIEKRAAQERERAGREIALAELLPDMEIAGEIRLHAHSGKGVHGVRAILSVKPQESPLAALAIALELLPPMPASLARDTFTSFKPATHADETTSEPIGRVWVRQNFPTLGGADLAHWFARVGESVIEVTVEMPSVIDSHTVHRHKGHRMPRGQKGKREILTRYPHNGARARITWWAESGEAVPVTIYWRDVDAFDADVLGHLTPGETWRGA